MISVKNIIILTLLLFASRIDIKKRVIPNNINIAIALTGLIDFETANLLGILIAVPFFLAALITNEKIGGGDVKLFAALGITLGFGKGIALVLVTLTAILFFYAISKGSRKKGLPLAPFVVVGYTIILLGGMLL